MQPGGDFSSSYYLHQYPPSTPNSNPTEFQPSNPPISSTFASAPPYSHYAASDYASAAGIYPSYSHNPDPSTNLPASAASFSQPQSQNQIQAQTPQLPSYQSYNPSSFPPEQQPSPFPHLQQPYFSQDSYQPASSYVAAPNPNPSPSPNPSFSPPYPAYETPYQSSGHYGGGLTGSYERSNSGFDRDFYDSKPESFRFDWGGDDGLNEGAYRYDGGKIEPYGARGTGGPARSSSSASWSTFDDYGRSTSFGSSARDRGSSGKIVRAVPKAETQQDVKNGLQKFRVKLLPEGSGSTMDVLCQIGLDGIRMLDPSTNRTLRIYPLETVTRWEVADPSMFTFWAKTSVDIEARRIRLQSNSYTTRTILDTVAAATIQLKEIGGKDGLSRSRVAADSGKQSDQTTEKKKGFTDWMNFIKPGNEEKDHWVPDEAVSKCASCGADFNAFVRKHHCRNCGDIFCDKCTHGRIALTAEENAQLVRVCDRCMSEVTQRLNNAREAASKPAGLQTHEELAKKLQEEMEKNRKSSTGSKTDGSGKRLREVACPICTVHLQVQVPASGSETIECGVCQNPFLVSAH